MSNKRPKLRQKIIIILMLYTLMLTTAVGLHGFIVNENIEDLVWDTVLNNEANYIRNRIQATTNQEYITPDGLYWYDETQEHDIPSSFRDLPAGLHDEIVLDNKLFVVLVEENAHKKQILALDITEIEKHETLLVTSMVIIASIIICVMACIGYWMLGRLMSPLFRVANEISTIKPDQPDQKIIIHKNDPEESAIIITAINQYIQRIQEYNKREQQFINTASHELRTPISVISGALEVVLTHPDTSKNIMPHLERVSRVTREMEELLTLLLALARDKKTLRGNAEAIDITAKLPLIIENHQYLCEGKELFVRHELVTPMFVTAPPQLLIVTINNLLRNAIENSNRGLIRIYALNSTTIVIDDPGHGMTAQEMSELYTKMAKTGKNSMSGIGLDLIIRICEHYGWTLSFESELEKGTRATLKFNLQ